MEKYDDPKVWELFQRGDTKGIFQLETNLGKQWAKKCQPSNISELAALLSILRPGCLKAISENKSMSQHYVDRKAGKEEITYLHESLRDILEPTYGVLIYQEQCMRIAQKLAGFTEVEADILRKAIGKKKADVMAEVRKDFIKGCESIGIVGAEDADQIFGWIEKSARYSFNKCIYGEHRLKRVAKGKHKFHPTINELYKIRNDISYAKRTGHISLYKKLKSLGHYGFGMSMFPDGRIRKNIIRNISISGKIETYKITLEDNSFVIVTKNHKFPTPGADVLCGDLHIGDFLYKCGEYEYTQYDYSHSEIKHGNLNYSHDGITEGFLSGSNNPSYTNGEYTKFVTNKAILEQECSECGATNCRIETHHVDGNRKNNELDNLENLCVSCHKRKEYASGRRKRGEKGYPVYLCKIKSIEYEGIKETYDITMDDPHNFVLDNNIVTCNSHAVCYAVDAYWSAFEKVYSTEDFFVAWLQYASEKPDPHEEVYQLISCAKSLDFKVATPKITNFKEDFNNVGKTIYFGVKNIKSLTGKNGDSAISAIESTLSMLNKKVENLSWLDILFYYSTQVNSTSFKALATVGFFRGIKDKISRNTALYEYNIFKVLTKTELAWVIENYPKKKWKTLLDCFIDLAPTKKEGGGTFKESRKQVILNEIKMLQNPPYSLEDDPEWIVDQESKLFGCPVSLSKVSNSHDINCNTTCKELLNGKKGKGLKVAGNITRVANFKIKKDGPNKGREMAFLTIEDETCSIDSVIVFPDCREENKYSIFEGSNVILCGNCEKDSFIVEKIYEI